MLKRLTAARLVAVMVATLLSACGDGRSALVAPMPGSGSEPAFGAAQGEGTQVKPVERATRSGEDISWSFDVGPEGRIVTHAASGLTISIPSGAVAAETRITVTALKGPHMSFRFAPHGLQFAAPVELRLPLNRLKLKRDPFSYPRLVGGYFREDSLAVEASTGIARVAEVLPLSVDMKTKVLRLEIHHFSGYTVASAVVNEVQVLP